MTIKHKHDEEYEGLLSIVYKGVGNLTKHSIDTGLVSEDTFRYSIETRQKKAKELVESGASLRTTAKLLGVDKKTISNDIKGPGKKSPKTGKKSPANADRDRAKEGDWDWAVSLFSKALIDTSRVIHVINEFDMNETRRERLVGFIKRLRDEADKLERTINGSSSPSALTSIKGGKS